MPDGLHKHRNGESLVNGCRLLVRKSKSTTELLEFVAGGLEVGQQVVVVAGPTCLKDLARVLTEHGLKTDALLRNGRLIFLTAPDCLAQLSKPQDALQRGPLRTSVSVVRWVTDWSWAYAAGQPADVILGYQRLVHDFIHAMGALPLCTVYCEKQERNSLFAMVADHRRAARPVAAAAA